MGFPTVPRPGRRGGWKRLVGGPAKSNRELSLSAASFQVYSAGTSFWHGGKEP